MSNSIKYSDTRDIPIESVLALYQLNNWSAADRPEELHRALLNSHSLITAWDGETLVGLANAISDGSLVVYYPHTLVRPEYRRRGIGRELMMRLTARYSGFHQQILIADQQAAEFYRRCGFVRAGRTEPMWIFAGTEH